MQEEVSKGFKFGIPPSDATGTALCSLANKFHEQVTEGRNSEWAKGLRSAGLPEGNPRRKMRSKRSMDATASEPAGLANAPSVLATD